MFLLKKSIPLVAVASAVALIQTFTAPSANAESQAVENFNATTEQINEHFENSRNFNASDNTSTFVFDPSSVEDVKKQEGVASPDVVGTCTANTGDGCEISVGKTLTATVSGEAGVGFDEVNASIGGSYAESVNQQWTCHGTPGKGAQLVMHPSGVFVQFTYVKRVAGVETSRTPGSAFIPTGIHCSVENNT